jgi:2-methylcitrate dehydratase PrpD
MGFDAAQTRQALNLAMSMSPANTWTPCLEGATIRNLYPGRSGFQGIMAAHLVGCGFTAVQDGPADLYRDVLGEGFDPAAVVDGLGRRGACRIQQNYFKFHACCFYNHPALDAVQALLRREEFAASDVEHIRVTAPPMALTMANPEPENMLSAKFSIPYAVAAALVHGSTGVTTFYPEKLADAQTRSLAQRVEVVADPEMNLRNYDHPASTVTVTLRDGRTLRESVTAHHGDARNPASRDELVGKFTFLAQNALGEEKVRQVIAVVDRLDDIEDIGELTRFLG